MKKLFLLMAFVGACCFTMEAQKSCSKATAAKGEKVCAVTAAAKAAILDTSIEKRVCSKSGSVSYVRKNVCSASGKVSFTDVEYCTKSSKFVNMSPSATATKSCSKSKAACTKKAATSGSAMKVSNKQASASAKKSCDPTKCTPAQIAACKKAGKVCPKTGAKTTSSAKLVKNEQ